MCLIYIIYTWYIVETMNSAYIGNIEKGKINLNLIKRIYYIV